MTPDTSPKPASTSRDAAMRSGHARRILRHLPTGVPGLDAVLGGGLPEFSFNMLAGGPGVGKTTLAQQILFTNASPERPALYFTVLGEPTVKMLRYQQQFGFFQPELVGSAVRFLNLSEEVLSGDLNAVLARMTAEVESVSPGIVVVDSFRTIRSGGAFGTERGALIDAPLIALEQFVQQLAIHLTSWEVTSLLIGEYDEPEQRQPLFTIADGIMWLTQAVDRNSVVRKLQVVKMRGQPQMPGLHTFRITDDGLQIFPRIPEQQRERQARAGEATRLSTGVPGLDAIMGGGIPRGDAVMIAGATGTGKTTVAMQFAADGLRRDESVVIVVFEEYPEAYVARLRAFDIDPDAMVQKNTLRVTYLRPLDLSVDETLAEILVSVRDTGATRVVIDSLNGFEIALAPAFREDFRESLYRLVGALTATGITVLMTLESVALSPADGFTGERVSFVTDDIIVLRYVELDAVLEKLATVAKMRRSQHSQQFWRYDISPLGVTLGEPLVGHVNILTGSPASVGGHAPARAGLVGSESKVLDALVRWGETPLASLATRVGLPVADMSGLMSRLVALGYAVRVGTDVEDAAYRAVARGESS